MENSRHGFNPGSNLVIAAVILLTIVILYFGSDIFVPFALAVLLSFMLAPPVEWLRRLKVPRVVAVLLVVTAAVSLLAGISVFVGSQVIEIARDLPTYENNIKQKIRVFRDVAPNDGAIDRTATVIQELGRELANEEEPLKKGRGVKAGTKEAEPLPVRVEPPEQQPLDLIQKVMGSVLGPIATAGLVFVFVFFVLLSPSDLRDRFIRLTGNDLQRTTEALSEAAGRVSHYLLMQLVVNATYAIPLGLGLYLIGVPGAFLWALLAMLLRYIPYLGPVIAAVFPLTLAFVVDSGWSMMLWTAALVLTLELVSNNVIEPWLYGASTGMTPLAVIISAIFWTLLWGPVGLILATPLTVCLVVLGHYVPQFKFIEVLLGSDPVLSSGERFYQRLLAANVEDAIDIAETEVKSESLLAFYDQTALPALRLAESDRQRGIPKEHSKHVVDGILAVVQDLRDLDEKQDEHGERPHQWQGTPVLCVAGRSEFDTAAAALMVHVLESRGIGTRTVPPSAVTLEEISKLDLAGVEAVFLCYLHPNPRAYARFVCRRLKQRSPNLKVILGALNLAPDAGPAEDFATATGADAVVATLETAANALEQLVGQVAVASAFALPVLSATEEAARLEALAASGLLNKENKARLDQVAHRVAEAMNAPIGLVSLIDDSYQLWRGAAGLPEELDISRKAPRELSICAYVIAADKQLVVEDTARDSRFSHNPLLRENGMRFYAGVPLRTQDGRVLGALCVIDKKPRTIAPSELKFMQMIADDLMEDLSGKQALAQTALKIARQSEPGTPLSPQPAS